MRNFIWLLIIVLVLIGIYFVFKGNGPAVSNAVSQNESVKNENLGANTVVYADGGFTPQTITIKKGQSVNFVSQTGNPMWVATNPHPAHTGYDNTSLSTHCAAGYSGPAPFDECQSGQSYTFKFDKAGTWDYHNHLLANDGGTVVVE